MADRLLLESGAPDGYLLEDGSGVLLNEVSIPYIQTATNTGTGSSVAVTIAGATTGSVFVVEVGADSRLPSSITGTGGTFASRQNATNSHNFDTVWVGTGVTAGTTTITVNFAGSTNSGVRVTEWAGVTDGTKDQGAGATGSGTAASAGPITPTKTYNLVIGSAVSALGMTAGPSGGFSETGPPLNFTGAKNLLSAYLIQTSATAATVGWTITSANWDAAIVDFEMDAGASFDPAPFAGIFGDDGQQLTQRRNVYAPDTGGEFVPVVTAAAFNPATMDWGSTQDPQQLRPFGHATSPTWETGGEGARVPYTGTTRLYPTAAVGVPSGGNKPATGPWATSAPFDASWEAVSLSDAVLSRGIILDAPITGIGSFGSLSTSSGTNAGDDGIAKQFVSRPLAGDQWIGGRVHGVFQTAEGDAAYDMRAQIVVRVFDTNGLTLRGVLYAGDDGPLVSEYSLTGAAESRRFPQSGSGVMTSVFAHDGDRIVIELGSRQHAAGSSSSFIAAVGSFLASGDFADTEGITTNEYPWIDFTGTLTFGNELTPAWMYDAQPFVSNAQRWYAPDAMFDGFVPIVTAPSFNPATMDWGSTQDPQQLRPFGHDTRPTWETGGEKYPASPPEWLTAGYFVSFDLGVAWHLNLTWTDPTGGTSALVSVAVYRRIPSATSAGLVLVGSVGPGVQQIDDYWGDFADYAVDERPLGWLLVATNAEGLTASRPAIRNATDNSLWSDVPDHQQDRSTAQRWFQPDTDSWVPQAISAGPTVAQLAPLWAEQWLGQVPTPWDDADVLLGVNTVVEPEVVPVRCLRDTIIAKSPGWYARFGEIAGTSLVDEIAANNGTYINSPTLGTAAGLTGDTDSAVTFTGSFSQRATVPDSAALHTGDVFSIFGRFQRGSVLGVAQVVFDKGQTGGNSFMLLFGASNKFQLADSAAATFIVRTNVTITDTLWHDYLIVKNGATATLYLDGVDVSQAGTPATLASSTDTLFIASSDTVIDFATVSLDETAIWAGTALTANDAMDLHAAVLCDATPYEFAPVIGYDAQFDRSNAQQWFAPEQAWAPTATGAGPAPPFDVAVYDWNRDPQQDRWIQPTWFMPDLPTEGTNPIPPGTTATVAQQAGLWYDAQPFVSNGVRWIHPDDGWFAQYVTIPTVVPPTTDQLGPLWGEQPYPEKGNAQFWYSPALEPVDGPLQTWLFTTGSPGGTPRVLIDAETGDVWLSLGGVLIIKAT